MFSRFDRRAVNLTRMRTKCYAVVGASLSITRRVARVISPVDTTVGARRSHATRLARPATVVDNLGQSPLPVKRLHEALQSAQVKRQRLSPPYPAPPRLPSSDTSARCAPAHQSAAKHCATEHRAAAPVDSGSPVATESAGATEPPSSAESAGCPGTAVRSSAASGSEPHGYGQRGHPAGVRSDTRRPGTDTAVVSAARFPATQEHGARTLSEHGLRKHRYN
ncbi:unnamed protein product [Parnassius apollo]|uniref:(apollo) hypothetical protein n=1 Tax=Parnassius apollo TaxID=110799 RepID=A0A8S3XMF6_PARAO|nr:unnamed protein product [Parnassius apollo]